MQAGMQTATAMAQPSNRGPMADAGWATATGSTKTSRAAVEALAAWGETIPANSTPNPTTAMTTTAATLSRETAVPRAMKPVPRTARPEVGEQSGPWFAGELHQQDEGERSEGSEQADLGVGEEGMGQAEDRR